MVYLIVCEENMTCKIGYSYDNAKGRLTHLRCASPYDIELKYWINGDQLEERRLHEHFDKYRLKREWFTLTDEILEYFATRAVDYVHPPKKQAAYEYCGVSLNPKEYKKYSHEELRTMVDLGRTMFELSEENRKSVFDYISLITPMFGHNHDEIKYMIYRACTVRDAAIERNRELRLLREQTDDGGINLVSHIHNNAISAILYKIDRMYELANDKGKQHIADLISQIAEMNDVNDKRDYINEWFNSIEMN
jgi:hypothetical protein